MKPPSIPRFPEKTLLAFIFFVLLAGCTQKTPIADETATDTTDAQTGSQNGPSATGDNNASTDPDSVMAAFIDYQGAKHNEVRRALENFSPLTAVLDAAGLSIAVKDSLEMVHRDADGNYIDSLTDPADSLIFRPVEMKAWQAIQEYKKWLEAGTPLNDACPSLLELTREVNGDDTSSDNLPQAGTSQFLAHGKFFFLGGAPFIGEVIRDDGIPFSDRNGNPEKRYSTILNENGDFLLNSIYHFRNVRTNLTFGRPLRSYDMGPQEVNGVGSLVHEFLEPVHVFFLTENGVLPARLLSTEVKLAPENLGCISDRPHYIFACGKNIDANEILAIYIPYQSAPVTEFKLTRLGNGTWAADLNEDGIADLACVQRSFQGEASGETLAEALWFVNVNGTWKIIDYATELDCT
jgi:hypothetical protein